MLSILFSNCIIILEYPYINCHISWNYYYGIWDISPMGITSDIMNIIPTVWVNYNNLTVLPHWKSWLVLEIIPKWPQDSG